MLDILDKYDVLLVDAYGVFWNGADFIKGTKETMKSMVQKGKVVIVLSNASQRTEDAMKKYAKLGLNKGEHYNEFVTSGEVMHSKLEAGLTIKGSNLKKYYTFGTPNNKLFEGLDYEAVPLDQAEFIYISVPQLTEEQKELLGNKYKLYESTAIPADGKVRWDTTDILAFSSELRKIKEIALAKPMPVLNANPDEAAPEKCKATNTTNFVVRQGAIANYLKEQGLDVYNVGKPYREVYSYCRELLIKKGVDVNLAKVVMIGDTIETDIAGAHNATNHLNWKVDSILTLTGNAARTMQGPDVCKKTQLQEMLTKYPPTAIIDSFGIQGVEVLDLTKHIEVLGGTAEKDIV